MPARIAFVLRAAPGSGSGTVGGAVQSGLSVGILRFFAGR
jgi:hypothetical protein